VEGAALIGTNLMSDELNEMLRPPTSSEIEAALAQFAANVRNHYGSRLHGLYLFGSRARGDHRPDSDADVAVILQDGDWVDRQPLPVILRRPRISRRLLQSCTSCAGLEG
jgi:predicted nucleotidyltransferase